MQLDFDFQNFFFFFFKWNSAFTRNPALEDTGSWASSEF